MPFMDQAAQDLASLFATGEISESGTYDGVPVRIVPAFPEAQVREGDLSMRDTLEVDVLVAEVPAPAAHAQVTVLGRQWTVRSWRKATPFTWTLSLEANRRPRL